MFAENKPNGQLHIAGVNIGKYESEDNWREIFEPLQESFEKMGEFSLSTNFKNQWQGKSRSLIERLMRTVKK